MVSSTKRIVFLSTTAAALLGLWLPFLWIDNAVAFQPSLSSSSRPLSIRLTERVRPTAATAIHRQPPSWNHHASSWDSIKQSSTITTTTSTNTQRSMMTLLSEASAAAAPTTAVSIFQNSDTWVFLAGVFPFAWAAVEFWRRVMRGESFGTGSDSIVFTIIGKDDAPTESRGRRVLGTGALITAYVLFAIAFGTIGVVLYSVLSSAPPPTEFLSSSSATTPLGSP